MDQPQYNIALGGDEARILMAAMMNTDIQSPIGMTILLFTRLNELSINQPPQQNEQ